MDVIVFVGPTLRADEVRAEIDAVVMPPVSQGDVYRAALDRPWGIGIVDGYFESVPAVWHKEILWAMSQGVHVFGAASMGALRAAELAAYGMTGVGAVFEAFRAGALTDDDEVAVVHGPEEEGCRPLSDALVGIRATLGRAQAEGVIDEAAHRAWLGFAKRTFYPHRSYAALFEEAAALGVPAATAARLRAWLPSGKLDVKRDDALAMLRVMRAAREASPEPKQVRFAFEHTDLWEQVGRRSGRRKTGVAGPETPEDPLLDELRLQGLAAFTEMETAALARALAGEEAARLGISAGDEEVARLARELAARQGIEAEGLDAWLAAHDLSAHGLARTLRGEADLQRVRALLATDAARALRDELRMRGVYAALSARAADKQRVLSAGGAESPAAGDGGESETEAEVVAAHFAERGEPVPAALDRYAASLGLPDGATFVRVLLRERWYRRLARGEVTPGEVTSPSASRPTAGPASRSRAR